ncbi:D-alanyl-D-alanine carboxypeptidase (penicillin-binding protein 5) [Legionella adelaidensis]|uniref:serine-type D-Ala-D-Ala carboxypeptidase n=1 Tax=Legionella adelaidensis TaxID=45056 RepID=A0A0W0R466_9GAMM|nr:D-alanyl-D-alanine carboxypeptidase family protein [Legionella adelaidensis]KTC65876.1 D-alanyl-D-alanine carboxypeptidase (penicillin-binding protein 5) [Legionella adelaidensis]
MNKPNYFLTSLLLFVTLAFQPAIYANTPTPDSLHPTSEVNNPLITPTPPMLNAKAYILIDVNSGKILAEKNSEEKLPPASLTKMMTLYVVSNALHNQQIHLNDSVRISQEAWKTGGSRMFVKEGEPVSVEDLLKGIIVHSGNDACVAMAEHVGGSESTFTELMNQQAKNLGMVNSHFTDSTGLPSPQLYTTAKDLAILGRALVTQFPEYYHWYKQKWFTYNGIRQPNRNRLLWRDSSVDGIKTGHTNDAGFCLVSSAKRDNMRLLAVVLGAPSDTSRADDSERLLNYGFRFFESHSLYKAGTPITQIPVYKGETNQLAAGLKEDQYITIPTGQYQRLVINTKVSSYLQAPIEKGDQVGELVVQFDNKTISTEPLYALESIPKGGFFTRMKDSVRLLYKRWFG